MALPRRSSSRSPLGSSSRHVPFRSRSPLGLPGRSGGSRGSRGGRGPRGPRSRYTTALLLLTALSLLVLDLPVTRPLKPVRNVIATIFRPVTAVTGAVFSPIGNGWKGAFGYDDVKKENDELKAKLAEVESQAGQLAQMRAERDDLLKMQGVDAPDAKTKLGRVVSGPISNFDQTVEIDLGSNDGVQRDMAVIAGLTEGDSGAIFGRVTQVRANSSTVTLITAASFRVGATFAKAEGADAEGAEVAGTTTTTVANTTTTESGATSTTVTATTAPGTVAPSKQEQRKVPAGEIRGVVFGTGSDRELKMEGIDPDADLAAGDWVLSIGGESRFPSDVVIGRIAKVERVNAGLSKTAVITPLAQLDGTLIKVVLKEAPR